MGNISNEIKIIDAEIEKTEKAILKEVEDYKEVERENLNHFKRYNDIPPKAKIFKETRKILVDAMLNGGKDLEAHKHTIKALQSRLNTLKQFRENKLNKIVFRENLEEVDKLQKEAEELKQRKAKLSTKYAKPEKVPQAKLLRGIKQPYADQKEFNDFMKKIIEKNPESSYLQIARKAISMMKKENRFLDDNGNPLYKEATLKNIILKLKKGLKHTKPSFSKLKNDGKVTAKKRHLKSDVET